MSRPPFCSRCGSRVPPDAPMPRQGVWWLCGVCWGTAALTVCADGAHDWAGAVDDHGSAIWGCKRCGARLQHQAISEQVVEAAPETPWIDC